MVESGSMLRGRGIKRMQNDRARMHKVTGSIQGRLNAKNKKVYDVIYRWVDIETGKKRQSMKRGFKRKGDAQDFLDKMKAEMEAGKLAPISRLTMAEVANEWFASEVE